MQVAGNCVGWGMLRDAFFTQCGSATPPLLNAVSAVHLASLAVCLIHLLADPAEQWARLPLLPHHPHQARLPPTDIGGAPHAVWGDLAGDNLLLVWCPEASAHRSVPEARAHCLVDLVPELLNPCLIRLAPRYLVSDTVEVRGPHPAGDDQVPPLHPASSSRTGGHRQDLLWPGCGS